MNLIKNITSKLCLVLQVFGCITGTLTSIILESIGIVNLFLLTLVFGCINRIGLVFHHILWIIWDNVFNLCAAILGPLTVFILSCIGHVLCAIFPDTSDSIIHCDKVTTKANKKNEFVSRYGNRYIYGTDGNQLTTEMPVL